MPERDVADTVEFVRSVPTDWLCNTDAVAAGRPDRARPSRSTLQAFTRRDDALVVHVDGGLAVFSDNPRRNAGYWRWLVVEPGVDDGETATLMLALAAPAVARWGRVFGRVRNENLRRVMLAHPDCRVDVDDPAVLWFEPAPPRG